MADGRLGEAVRNAAKQIEGHPDDADEYFVTLRREDALELLNAGRLALTHLPRTTGAWR